MQQDPLDNDRSPGGKVAFRSCVSLVGTEKEGDKQTRFEVEHQPVGAKFERKKVRRATGFVKKSAVESEEEKETDESEDDDDRTTSVVSSRLSSTTTTARSTSPSESRSSSGGGGANVAKKKKEASSEEEAKAKPRQRLEEGGERQCWLCELCGCSDVDSGEVAYEGGELVRRQSSVGIGNVVEIEDADADRHWHDEPRHEDRWKRIRHRVPTGNPKLMKASSEELLDLLQNQNAEMFTKEELEELQRNTEANANVCKAGSAGAAKSPKAVTIAGKDDDADERSSSQGNDRELDNEAAGGVRIQKSAEHSSAWLLDYKQSDQDVLRALGGDLLLSGEDPEEAEGGCFAALDAFAVEAAEEEGTGEFLSSPHLHPLIRANDGGDFQRAAGRIREAKQPLASPPCALFVIGRGGSTATAGCPQAGNATMRQNPAAAEEIEDIPVTVFPLHDL